MTRKHFQAIAAAIRDSEGDFKSAKAHAMFAAGMAGTLRGFNPFFDPKRFMEACRPTWVVGTASESHWDRAIDATKGD